MCFTLKKYANNFVLNKCDEKKDERTDAGRKYLLRALHEQLSATQELKCICVARKMSYEEIIYAVKDSWNQMGNEQSWSFFQIATDKVFDYQQ